MAGADLTTLRDLAPGAHVAWVVDDRDAYLELAEAMLCDAKEKGEKAFLFGPEESEPIAELGQLAAVALDPRLAILTEGTLDPAAMFSMFREQAALAREERYRGVRVVADMDWLLPTMASSDEIISFELQLDQLVKTLGATIVCAYSVKAFGPDAVEGTLSVHPTCVGHLVEPRFQLVAGDDRTWQLSGEVDIADAGNFDAAVSTAVGAGDVELDVSELTFIDVAGMRAIAQAARAAAGPVCLVGARTMLHRGWTFGGFAELAPNVVLAR